LVHIYRGVNRAIRSILPSVKVDVGEVKAVGRRMPSAPHDDIGSLVVASAVSVHSMIPILIFPIRVFVTDSTADNVTVWL
jgi:hypothetical protein